MTILNYHAAVGGATQTGKTTTALSLLSVQPGLKVFMNLKNDPVWHKHFHYIAYGMEGLQNAMADLLRENRYDSLLDFEPDPEESFLDVSYAFKYLWTVQRKIHFARVTIALDEAQNVMSARSVMTHNKDKRQCPIKQWFAQGLSLSMFGIIISQRFSNIHADILHNCEVFILHQIVDQDVDYLLEKGSVNAREIPKLVFQPKCGRKHGDRTCEVSHSYFIQFNVLDGVFLVKA